MRDDEGAEIKVHDCPNRLLRGSDVWTVIEWFAQHREGVQLFAGYGAAELPPKLNAAFRLIASESAYWDEKAKKRGKDAEH